MAKEIVIPEYLKGLVDEASIQSEHLISTADSVPRISLKGRKFRFIIDGEEVDKVNDKTHVVILGVQPERAMAKTFYAGKYNPDSSDPPDCSSTDGIKPDVWISDPQNAKCMGCPQSMWGSAESMSGGKAKACRDSKRLMVVRANDIGGTMYILNVTISSLKNLSAYGKILVENSVPMAAAITTLIMDDDSDFPKLVFEFMGILKEKPGTAAMARSAKREWADLSQQALSHDGDGDGGKKKQLTQDEDEEDDDEDAAKEAEVLAKKKAKLKKKKLAEKKAAAAAAAAEEDDDDDVIEGELEEDDDSSAQSDVDDLLEGWDDD